MGVLSVGHGPGLDSMSPARSRRSASHAAGTHGWLPQKTGRPGLRRGGVGGYNLHSVPPNSPPDCGTVAHQPRAGCIRLVLLIIFIIIIFGHLQCSHCIVAEQDYPSISLSCQNDQIIDKIQDVIEQVRTANNGVSTIFQIHVE